MSDMDPWGLTPRQRDVMDALIQSGCNKRVARELGMEIKTVEGHMWQIKRAMGGADRVLAALKWDRFRREGAQT